MKQAPPPFADALKQARIAISESVIRLDERVEALEIVNAIDRALQQRAVDPATPAPTAPIEREREGRMQAEGALRRLEFLFDGTSALSAAPLNSETRLDRLASMLVPDLADWCLVDVVTLAGAVQRRIRQWNPLKTSAARAMEGLSPLDVEASFGPHHVIRASREERQLGPPGGATTSSSATYTELLTSIGARSQVIAPLVSAGRTIGALTVIFAESARSHTDQDVAIITDLAARAGVALESAALFEELERMVNGRDEMVAVVSHDLRNPHTAIRMSATLLQRAAEKRNEPDAGKQTAVILRCVDRMNALIRDLLDVATIDAGRVTLQLQSRPMWMLLAEVQETLSPLAAAKNVRFEVETDGADFDLRCDPDRLMQVFSNLVGNAVKFTPTGGSIVVTGARAGDAARFSVRDTGAGIDGEQLPHVFDRFWRGKEGAREHGAGLGLAIVKGIVEAHGGEVGVESVKGSGTKFFFVLPIRSPSASPTI